jgi:hypothetical protein
MSSDSFERFGKLMAGLGKLFLDDRRHRESVNAVLQKLVWEKYEWPKSKDWNAIRYVAQINPAMAGVLANLDIDNQSPITQQIIAAFPDCFREEPVTGPVPLSCIRAMAIKACKEQARTWELKDQDDDYWASLPQSFGVLNELNLPYVTYVTSSNADRYRELPMLPEPYREFGPTAEQWCCWTIDGQTYLVAENNQNSGVEEIVLVPVEYLDPTC